MPGLLQQALQHHAVGGVVVGDQHLQLRTRARWRRNGSSKAMTFLAPGRSTAGAITPGVRLGSHRCGHQLRVEGQFDPEMAAALFAALEADAAAHRFGQRPWRSWCPGRCRRSAATGRRRPARRPRRAVSATSAGMPMPVSRHREAQAHAPPSSADASARRRASPSPRSVNLTALPARLSRTCRRWPASPCRRSGHVGVDR